MMIQEKHEMIMMCAFALLLLGSAKVMVADATTDSSSNEIDGIDDNMWGFGWIALDIFAVLLFLFLFVTCVWAVFAKPPLITTIAAPIIINKKKHVAPRIVNNKLMQDIIQSLPSFAFSTTTTDVEEGTSHPRECGICLSNFKDADMLRMLPNCDHTFHVSCIDPWLAHHSDCPMCRMKVVVDAPTANTRANAMQPSDPLEVVVDVDASRPDM